MKHFEQNNAFYYVYNASSIFFFFLNDYIISFEFSFNFSFDDDKKSALRFLLKSRIFRDFSRFRFIIIFSIDLLFFSIDVFVLKNRSQSQNMRQFLKIFFFICVNFIRSLLIEYLFDEFFENLKT